MECRSILTARERYFKAHEEYTKKKFPVVYADGHYSKPVYPKVNKSNGLTLFIINFLNWSGHRATRINTQGRMIKGKWIHSSTRRGSADVSSTIRGRSAMWEVKVGRDRPSEYQLAEQAKERAAGGIYEFIRIPEEFFDCYDRIK